MKNLKLLRILVIALGIFAGSVLVNAQDNSKTSGLRPMDKQEYYRLKKEAAKATPPSAAVKYEQEKMARYKTPVQTPKIVFRDGTPVTAVTRANTPSNRTVLAVDAKSHILNLRSAAMAKGLPTAKYDAALEELSKPIHNQTK